MPVGISMTLYKLIYSLTMKYFRFLTVIVGLSLFPAVQSQRSGQADRNDKLYEASWESLDSRPTPDWYRDAKFGIFIHWGLYAVPSYSNKGTYAEWYWHALSADTTCMGERALIRNRAVTAFHNRQYGEDFEYPDFRKMFTCELFDPGEWADIFERSGAKYIVLTSKHHDGFCLWPNKEASKSFGMAWNSVEAGPHRDLVGDLTNAVRKRGLKMGYYYSLWDWFNPLWTEEQQKILTNSLSTKKSGGKTGKNKDSQELINESKAGLNSYIHKNMYPQFKELVTTYEPALIFSDGDWWMNDELWQTKPLLAWLFNNASNMDELVINDRWGEVRGKHGGYFTTEYGSGFEDPDILWEENRGMGMSFGYNRIENIDDYRTEQELIFLLVDLVSRGGNLLLNIGPTSDGRIPVIMQDRLLRLGAWLDVNGEAIYGTRSWKKFSQWGEGIIPDTDQLDYHHSFPLFELTLDPKEGCAVKEFFFTKKGNTLYAFSPQFPSSEKIFIRDVKADSDTKVSLLGCAKQLPFEVKDGGMEIDISSIGINDISVTHMHAFKLTGVH